MFGTAAARHPARPTLANLRCLTSWRYPGLAIRRLGAATPGVSGHGSSVASCEASRCRAPRRRDGEARGRKSTERRFVCCLDNANALPTYPQQRQKREESLKILSKRKRTESAGAPLHLIFDDLWSYRRGPPHARLQAHRPLREKNPMRKYAFILALAVLAASPSLADNMPVNADGLTAGPRRRYCRRRKPKSPSCQGTHPKTDFMYCG